MSDASDDCLEAQEADPPDSVASDDAIDGSVLGRVPFLQYPLMMGRPIMNRLLRMRVLPGKTTPPTLLVGGRESILLWRRGATPLH